MTRRGLTTLELLVALAITTITGLGVAMVITSVSRGITMMNETRGAMQRASASHVRLRSLTDTALCLLAHDERGLAVWSHDERANNQVNVSELSVLWFDDDADELCLEYVVYPEEMPSDEIEKADITLGGAEDPFQAMLDQRSLGFTECRVVADGVDSLTVTHASEDPTNDNRFRVLVAFQAAGRTEDMLLAAGLPSYRKPE